MKIIIKAESTTLILNNTIISDFLNGDTLELAPLNQNTSRVYGSNRSVNVQQRADREVHTLKMRIMKHSDTDTFLQNYLNLSTPLFLDGSLKEIVIKDGSEKVSSWILEAGSITAQPTDIKNNQDGNALMEYTLECFAIRLQ